MPPDPAAPRDLWTSFLARDGVKRSKRARRGSQVFHRPIDLEGGVSPCWRARPRRE